MNVIGRIVSKVCDSDYSITKSQRQLKDVAWKGKVILGGRGEIFFFFFLNGKHKEIAKEIVESN